MIESVRNVKNQIDAAEIGAPEVLSIELFDKSSKKSTKLINNVDPEKYIDSRSQSYKFELKEPILVNDIIFEFDGYLNHKYIEFEYVSAGDGSTYTTRERIGSGVVTANVNDVITSFSVRPEKQYVSNTKFKSVVVNGLDLDSLESVIDKIGDTEEYLREIRSKANVILQNAEEAQSHLDGFESRKSALNDEIAALEEKHQSAENEHAQQLKELGKVRSKIETSLTTESEISTRLEDLHDKVDQKKKESSALTSAISDLENQLKGLKDDINIFPLEISGFVSQGASNIKVYLLMAAIPLFLLVGYTWELFASATDLLSVYNSADDIDIWELLMSRMPFVFISLFVIHASYKLAKTFITEIMKINQQRLNLAKIGIIAKDVTDSSVAGLDGFTDDDIYELRTKLKMELLRSHLKSYLSEDYKHDLDISLWDRLKLSPRGKRYPEESAADVIQEDDKLEVG